MKRAFPYIRPSRLLILFLGIGLLVRLWIAWLPLPDLLRHVVADDMFYYLEIARNVVAGGGVTFDGETPTNGFHPLYLTLLLPLARFLTDPERLVHMTLSLLALLGVLAALPIYLALRREHGISALLASVLWLLHPYAIVISLSGVEVPVSVLLIGIGIVLLLRNEIEVRRRSLLLGLLAGLAFLARTDNVFWGIALFLGGIHLDRRRLVVGGGVAVAPWVAWNLIHFGRFVQDSGAIIAYRYHALFRMRFGEGWMHRLPELLLDNVATSQKMLLGRMGGVFPLLLLLLLLWRWRGSPERLRFFRPVLPVLLFLLLHRGFYTLYFWHQQYWYLLAPLYLLLFLAGYFDTGLRREGGKGWVCRIVVAGWVASFLSLPFAAALIVKKPFYPGQPVWLEAARSLDTFVGEGARVGAFNAGIPAFFAKSVVINLDGVVNPEVGAAIRSGRLDDYVREKGITHILDQEAWILLYARFAAPGWIATLAPLHVFPTHSREGPLYLLRVLDERGVPSSPVSGRLGVSP